MSTVDKLRKLIETKKAIRESIINKGTDVGTDVPFSQYPAKIDEIRTSEYKNPEFYELRTRNGTNYAGLFAYMQSYNEGELLDLRKFDVTNVNSMNSIFYNCTGYNLNVSGWNTANVNDFSQAFYYFRGNVDISSWKFDSATSVSHMFSYADLTGINGIESIRFPQDLQYLSQVFYYANNAGKTLDLSKWNIDNFYSLDYPFTDLNTKKLDLTNWNTSNVTNMYSVFQSPYIEELIIPDWCITESCYYSGLFGWSSDNIRNLKYIDASRCDDYTLQVLSNEIYEKPTDKFINIAEIRIRNNAPEDVVNTFISKGWRPLGPQFNIESCEITTITGNEILVGKNTECFIVGCSPWYADVNNIEFVSTDENYVTIDGSVIHAKSLGNVEIQAIDKSTGEIKGSITISIVESFMDNTEIVYELRNNAESPSESLWINDNYYPVTKVKDNIYKCSVGEPITRTNGSLDQNVIKLIKFNTKDVTTLENLFTSCTYLESDEVIKDFDTSNVTSLNMLFQYCSSLTSLNLANWDTINVTDMSQTFYYCSSLTSLNLANWNTSKVDNFSRIFADCSSLTSLNLANWEISNVVNTHGMFENCNQLRSIKCNVASSFDAIAEKLPYTNGTIYTTCNMEDISEFARYNIIEIHGWNIVQIADNPVTFATKGSKSLTVNENDVSSQVFEESYENDLTVCSYYPTETVFSVSFENNDDLVRIDNMCDTTNITSMERSFSGCSSLKEIKNTTTWKLSNLKNTVEMFNGCSSLEKVMLYGWNNKETAIKMSRMFYGCSSLKFVNMQRLSLYSNLQTDVFTNCDSLWSLGLNNANTINNLASQLPIRPNNDGIILSTCNPDSISNITAINNRGWNVQKEIQPIMFTTNGSRQLTVNNVDVSGQVEEVVSEVSLFSEGQPTLCQYTPDEDITQVSFAYNSDLVEVVQLDTSNVSNMNDMFFCCSSLSVIPDIDTSSATTMDTMYANCSSMTGYADPDKYWNNPNVVSANECFQGCTMLENYNDLPASWKGNQEIPVESISLGENVTTTESTYQLVCTFTPEDTTQRNVEWLIDDTSTIATLDQNGLLTRLDYGSVWVGCRSTDVSGVVHHIEVTFEEPENTPSEDYTIQFKSYNAKTAGDHYINGNVVTLNSDNCSIDEETGIWTYDVGAPLTEFNRDPKKGLYTPSYITEFIKIDLSNIYDLTSIFNNYQYLTSLPTTVNTENITGMAHAFANCRKITSIPTLDTTNVTSLYYTFNGTSITEIPEMQISNSGITNLESAFQGCSKLTNADLSSWDVTGILCLRKLFGNCQSLRSVNFSNWDLKNLFKNGYNEIQIFGDPNWVLSADKICENLTEVIAQNVNNKMLDIIVNSLPTKTEDNPGRLVLSHSDYDEEILSTINNKYWNIEVE